MFSSDIVISLDYLLFSHTLWCLQISAASWCATAWANPGENGWVTSLRPMRIDLKAERCGVTEAGLLQAVEILSHQHKLFSLFLFFFNCVLGLSELFSSLLDKNCWMCSNTASRYSCPFIATDSAARLMGSLTWFRNKEDAVQRLTPSAACFGAGKGMGLRWRNTSCCCRDSYQRHHYPDHGVRVPGLSLSHQAVRTV